MQGIMYPAAKPMAAEPRLNPVNMTVIINDRLRCGAYSDSSVVAFGMAAPMPIPASRRRTAISVGEDAYAAARVSVPNKRMETIRTSFRPNLSDDGPATKAPITRPNGAALMTIPNAGLEMFHSCRIEGVTKPMMATSMPSAATTRKHMATRNHWNAEIGRPSMKDLMSTVPAAFSPAVKGAARPALPAIVPP